MKSTMISKGQSLHRSSVISNQSSSAFNSSAFNSSAFNSSAFNSSAFNSSAFNSSAFNSSTFEMNDDSKQEVVTKKNPLLHWESELETKTEYNYNVTSDDESNTKTHI